MKQDATAKDVGPTGDATPLRLIPVHNSGGSQSVELPDDCRFGTSKVYVRRMGKAVLLTPEDDPWAPLVDSLSGFSDDYMAERNQPAEQIREEL